MKQKSNYKLRPGVVLQIAGSSQVYTNDNLTDEIAEEFLRKHPKASGRFEVIPSHDKKSHEEATVADALHAAEARIATLEAENAALMADIAKLKADEKGQEAPTEEAEKATEEAFAMNDVVRQAINEELHSGKSKTAIKQELAGKEIGGVKLTHRLIADYIDRLTAEE